ncbi:MAG: hypothetical protein E6F99_09710 [Actinobacteria bacterium]|nr:MAG: hypothetical protein E6F99_09710 [Actinomycetota bacterium]
MSAAIGPAGWPADPPGRAGAGAPRLPRGFGDPPVAGAVAGADDGLAAGGEGLAAGGGGRLIAGGGGFAAGGGGLAACGGGLGGCVGGGLGSSTKSQRKVAVADCRSAASGSTVTVIR